MTRRLTWRPVVPGDRQELEGFVCTLPDLARFGVARRVHDRSWEHQVQSWIRASSWKGPDPGCVVLAGEDKNGIAAVCAVRCGGAAGLSGLMWIGISTHLRNPHGDSGSGYGDEAIEVGLEAIAERSEGIPVIPVIGNVHRKNIASKRMLERAGFTFENITSDPDYETWVLPLEIGEPPEAADDDEDGAES